MFCDEGILVAVHTLPDLPYDYGALEPAMTGEILELHHSRHHATYVKRANDTPAQLAEVGASATPTATVGLEKTLALNLSGHVLHSIFWQNLSPDGGDRPDGALGVDDARAAGCLLLADLAVAMLAPADGREIDAVASELSLHIAELAPTISD